MNGVLDLVGEAIALVRRANDPVLEAMHLHYARAAHVMLGDTKPARADGERALALATEMGVPREVGRALAGLGEVSCAEGDLAASRTFFERALSTFEEQDEPIHVMTTLRSLMLAVVDQGDGATARAILRRERAAWSDAGRSPGGGAPILRGGAYLLGKEGKYTPLLVRAGALAAIGRSVPEVPGT